MSWIDELNKKAAAQAGAGSLPQPVAGPSRMWTPSPMPNIPFMPAAQVGPQSIARFVMPGAPNSAGPTAPPAPGPTPTPNVAPPAPGGMAPPAPGGMAPQPGNFWQRIGTAMRSMPQLGGRMNPLLMWALALKSGLSRPGMPQMPLGMNPGAVLPPRPMITPMNPA